MEQQDNNDIVQERDALKLEIHDQQQMIAKKTYVTKKSEKTIAGRMLPIKVLHLAVLTLEKQTTLSAKESNKLKAHTKALKKITGYNNADTNSNIARHKHLEDNKLALCMLKSKMSAYNSLLEGKEPECVIDTDEQAAAKYEDEMAKQNKEADEQADEEDPGNDNMVDGEGNQDNEAIIVVNDGGQGSQSGQSGQGPVKSEFEG